MGWTLVATVLSGVCVLFSLFAAAVVCRPHFSSRGAQHALLPILPLPSHTSPILLHHTLQFLQIDNRFAFATPILSQRRPDVKQKLNMKPGIKSGGPDWSMWRPIFVISRRPARPFPTARVIGRSRLPYQPAGERVAASSPRGGTAAIGRACHANDTTATIFSRLRRGYNCLALPPSCERITTSDKQSEQAKKNIPSPVWSADDHGSFVNRTCSVLGTLPFSAPSAPSHR